MGTNDWGGNDRGPIVNAVTWSMAGLVLFAVTLRLISRTCFKTSRIGLDDYITIFCVLVNIAGGISMSIAVAAGMGKHIQDILPSQLSDLTLKILIVQSINVWACSLPKLAIIALLERILRLKSWTRILFWGLGVVNQLATLALAVVWWTRCSPVRANYDPTVPGAVCGDFSAIEAGGYLTASMNPALDIFFTLYPIPLIMKLNMNFRRRLGIALGLGTGVLASGISIYKLAFIPAVVAELNTDPTYGVVPVDLFTYVEASLLLITASLLTIGPLWRWARDQSQSLSHRRATNHSSGTRTWLKLQNSDKFRGSKGNDKYHSNAVPVETSEQLSKVVHPGSKEGIQRTVEFTVSHEDV